MASSDQTRLLLVEDVPQVAQYVRGLLNAQSRSSCSTSISRRGQGPGTDPAAAAGRRHRRRAAAGPRQGPAARRAAPRGRSSACPVIVLTVPQNAGQSRIPTTGIDGVLSMPFSGLRPHHAGRPGPQGLRRQRRPGRLARIVSVFAPKGGVGKTTLAFNLAVALGQLEQRTVLIDGSLQFGDLRRCSRCPPTRRRSSTCRPTGSPSRTSRDVLWRDPSGIDILLAPPRIEMAEMVTVRDVEKALSLLRRVYDVDRDRHARPTSTTSASLPRRERHDPRGRDLRLDDDPQHVAMADTFRAIGYPAAKVRYLVNRADSPGGIDPRDLERALGRVPEHQSSRTASSWCSPTTKACRSCSRSRARRSARTSIAWRGELLGQAAGPGSRGARLGPRGDRPPSDRRLRLRRRRADRPSRDPPPDPGRIDRLPRRQRARAVRHPPGRRGPRVLDAVPRRARRARRQGHRRRLQHVDRGRARRPAAALRPADPRRDPARRRRPPRSRRATGGSA